MVDSARLSSRTTLIDSNAQRPEDVVRNVGFENLSTHAPGVKAKAMELTDSWGQAMFVMDKPLVERLFSTLGFSDEVVSEVFDGVRALNYVEHKQKGIAPQGEMTWHATDATCMTLRGHTDLGTAMSHIDDDNVEQFLDSNRALFDDLMDVMPDYASHLMFSPEVAETVATALGGNITADKIYALAWKYGNQVTMDLEGRRGVSTQFVRSLTLTMSARV